MARVGRPKKVRYIQQKPKVLQFSPRGRPGRPDEVSLTYDEFEALKLVDHQGFNQEEAAMAMRISRPSFGRILRKARALVADALVNGKSIHIRLGDVQIGVERADHTFESLQDAIVSHRLGVVMRPARLDESVLEADSGEEEL